MVAGVAVGIARAESPHGQAQFRSEVQLVPLTVTVTTHAGRYLPGLTADDFVVFEEGRPQTVSYFATVDSPVDLALLIDTSASMSRDLPLAQAAACGLVRRMKPGDRQSVSGISSSMFGVQGLTGDPESVENAIRSLQAAGMTALYESIYILLRDLERASRAAVEVRRQAIVLLSDGRDNASRIDFEAVRDAVRRGGVAVYVVLLDPDAPDPSAASRAQQVSEAAFRMRELARESGGQIFTPRSASELPAIYEAIGQELQSQYLLGYTPTRPADDGKFRRIAVRVRHRDAAHARTRAGYYAAPVRRTLGVPRPGQ